MKKMWLVVAAVAVVSALAPLGASADHCPDVFIFQGVDAGNDVRRGLNTGFVGCTADENDESLNTNLVVPGAQVAIVGVVQAFQPTTGTLQIGSSVTSLTWTLNTVQGRYESQSVPISEVANMTATVSNAAGETISVTYTVAA